MTDRDLAVRSRGSLLFLDIVGFTALGRELSTALGARRGTEELVRRIDALYAAMNQEVIHHGGSVVSFAGDAVLAWFGECEGDTGRNDLIADNKPWQGQPSMPRALTCALAMRRTVKSHAGIALKLALAHGDASRLAVGDPLIQRFDTLAGAAVERLARAAAQTRKGEIVIDEPGAELIGNALPFQWREHPNGERYRVIAPESSADTGVDAAVETTGTPPTAPEPATPPHALPTHAEERLGPWVLRAVRERERAGHLMFYVELKPTVALFARIAGIDHERDAQAGEKLDLVVRRVQAIAAQYGGDLLQLTLGDKGGYVYVSFGATLAHEDDELRGAHAARALLSESREWRFLRPPGIGVSSGITRVGAYGGARRSNFGALGDDVNLAARLMEHARPGEILVTESVRRAVSKDYALQALQPLTLRGRTEPLVVHALGVERRSRAVRLQERRYARVMVGRQTELARIEQLLARSRSGQAQFIGVSGEPGIGKSRLMAEVQQYAQRHGFQVATGLCEGAARHSPYHAWRPVWRALLGLHASEGTAAHEIMALAARLRALTPGRVEALPVLGPLLGLAIDDNDFTRPLASQDRANVLAALLQDALAALAATQPVLIAIEDLHWIDPLSLELLEVMARGSRALPLAVVMAYRPAEDEGDTAVARARQLQPWTQLTLQALGPDEVVQLVASRLAQWEPDCAEALAPALAARLDTQAEGNPFYIEELLLHLREQYGTLQTLVQGDRALTIELPGSLQSLILSRIDRLSEPQRATLKTASVVGRQFRVDWLLACYPALGDTVKEDLKELERLDLTPLDTPEPELAYLFKHAVTREVTYNSLSQATRLQLHGQLARFIESLGAQRHLDLLVHHYSLAEEEAKQREYLRRAADAAQQAYANETAIGYCERLLALLDEPAERAPIELQRGSLLAVVGRFEQAEVCLQAAMNLAEKVGDLATHAAAAVAMAALWTSRGDNASSGRWTRHALQIWRTLGALKQQALAIRALARDLDNDLKHEEAHAHLEQALDLANRSGDASTRATVMVLHGLNLYELGKRTQSLEMMQTALDIARRTEDKATLLGVLRLLMIVATKDARYQESEALHSEGLKLARTLGNRDQEIRILRSAAWMNQRIGNDDLALADLEEAEAAARAIGAKLVLQEILETLARLAAARLDYASATRLSEEMRTLARELSYPRGEFDALEQLSDWAICTGEFARAQTLLDEAWALARDRSPQARFPILSLYGMLSIGRGELRVAADYMHRALSVQREVMVEFETLFRYLAATAGLLARIGQAETATTLAAAVDAKFQSTRLVLDPYTAELLRGEIAMARAALDAAAFDAAWTRGLQMSHDDVIALALEASAMAGEAPKTP